MKLSIIGDVAEGKEGVVHRHVITFLEDQKGGGCAVIAAGTTRLLHIVEGYSHTRGYPCILLANQLKLAVLNADRVLLLPTLAYSVDDVVGL